MALANKKFTRFYATSGTDADKVADDKLLKVKGLWEADVASGANLALLDNPILGPVIYQMQQMQDELDEIRRHAENDITSNVSTNLSVTARNTGLTINSSDGTNASIPAATTSSWGAMSDSQATNNTYIPNNTLKGSTVGYYPAKTGNYVWIPATQFYGEHTALGKNTYITQTGTKSVSAYEWPGMFGKKVIEVKAWTDSAVTSGVIVSRITATNGTVASLGTGNTNADVDITDWNCTMGETLKIAIALKSTSIKLYGVHLKIDDA